jgi:integrase
MQEVRRLKPSTTSRRMSIVAGFYRTAVIDGVLEHSPSEHVRRPHVPAESPTLGLQLEALLTAARQSPNRYDFALVCLLGLLGLRIFEATGLDIADLGEEHGHRVIRVLGKGGKTVLVPLPPAVGRALDRAIGDRAHGPILLNTRGARMDRHAATRRLRALVQATGMRMPPLHPHISVRRCASSVGSGALACRRSLHSWMGLVPAACDRVGATTGGAARDVCRDRRVSLCRGGLAPTAGSAELCRLIRQRLLVQGVLGRRGWRWRGPRSGRW